MKRSSVPVWRNQSEFVAIYCFWWKGKSLITAFAAAIVLFIPHLIEANAFDDLCAAAGVVRCVNFDSSSFLVHNDFGTYTEGIDSYTTAPVIDSTVFSNGTGSLKFTIPANGSAGASGYFYAEFTKLLSSPILFGANTDFYVQFRQRFDPVLLNTRFGGDGWKQAIVGSGDIVGKRYYTCSDLELVIENVYYRGLPSAYNSCKGGGSPTHPIAFADMWTSDPAGTMWTEAGPYIQPGRPSPYCKNNAGYFNPGDCIGYFANEWMTFQEHFTLGDLVNGEWQGHFTLKVAREGQDGVVAIDMPWNFTASGAQQYGKVILTPYDTNRSGGSVDTYTWYDDLIISTQPIAMLYPPPTGTTQRRGQITSQ
jgi:hypothetical protein